MDTLDSFDRIVKASAVFTPGAPINRKDLFAGRIEQVRRVVEAIPAAGRHPILFGRRGVGKTSLANIISEVVDGLIAVKVSCDGSDTFGSIWNRVLQNASVTFKQKAFGFSKTEEARTVTFASLLGHAPNGVKPAEVGSLLARINKSCVIIFDEFDKVADADTKSCFADLIKIISDTAPKVTLIMVGVADNIRELIGEHPSIERNLVQIDLPPMEVDEIRSILTTGFSKLSIAVDDAVLDEVPPLADGYPHYAHLIGLCSVKACINADTTSLVPTLFPVACSLAVADAIEKYRDAYATATTTTQQSRYPMILCACSYANCDDRGVFRATDVVEAVRRVFNETLTVQAVVPALGEFITPHRDTVLTAVPVGKRKCYRFTDPMMRPFLRLKSRDVQAVVTH